MNTYGRRAGPLRIADVARLAGVSAATVSRVLSRPDMVADQTRETVLKAVRDSGYRMNHAARNLRQQRAGAVVALVPNLGNPFFAEILAGLGRALEAAGYDLLISDTLTEGGQRRALHRFLDPSRADGIVLLDGLVSVQELSPPHPTPPILMACEWIEGDKKARVVLDNAMGTELAAQHLVDLGHRRIVCIGGPPANILHQTRLAGVRRVLGDDFTVFDGDFSLVSGLKAARKWLAQPTDQRATGVISFSDEMACAFISSLQGHGISVPQDLSVIGFDDIALVSHLTPALTTVRQPKRKIGRLAAESILALIEGRPVADVVLVPPQMMLRDSTGPVPK